MGAMLNFNTQDRQPFVILQDFVILSATKDLRPSSL